MDKSIMFLFLAVLCFYIVLSEFYGNKPITDFLKKLLPED